VKGLHLDGRAGLETRAEGATYGGQTKRPGRGGPLSGPRVSTQEVLTVSESSREVGFVASRCTWWPWVGFWCVILALSGASLALALTAR
jgi:hypothetical protein